MCCNITQVCVPLDPVTVWDFDPDAVPTVASLLAELDAKGEAAAGPQVRQARLSISSLYTSRTDLLSSICHHVNVCACQVER